VHEVAGGELVHLVAGAVAHAAVQEVDRLRLLRVYVQRRRDARGLSDD